MISFDMIRQETRACVVVSDFKVSYHPVQSIGKMVLTATFYKEQKGINKFIKSKL